jgi:hypothetical protein
VLDCNVFAPGAGTTHADLEEGAAALTGGRAVSQLFAVPPTCPGPRLAAWLAEWIAAGGWVGGLVGAWAGRRACEGGWAWFDPWTQGGGPRHLDPAVERITVQPPTNRTY